MTPDRMHPHSVMLRGALVDVVNTKNWGGGGIPQATGTHEVFTENSGWAGVHRSRDRSFRRAVRARHYRLGSREGLRALPDTARDKHRRMCGAPQDQALRAALLAPVLTAAAHPPGSCCAPGRKNASAPNQRTGLGKRRERYAATAVALHCPTIPPFLRAPLRSEVQRRHARFR